MQGLFFVFYFNMLSFVEYYNDFFLNFSYDISVRVLYFLIEKELKKKNLFIYVKISFLFYLIQSRIFFR